MKGVMITPPHGIVFVLDPQNKDSVIPEYVAGKVVSCTDSCVSVATQAPVDGETAVFMGRQVEGVEALIHVGQCGIWLPNGMVALITSDLDRVFECEVTSGRVTVSVWVDSLEDPARIVIQVEDS